MGHYTYLFIDLGCILIPFLASFYAKRPFHKEWKYFFMASISVGLFFLIWDNLFIEYGIWGFEEKYTMGIDFFNLPIEEILFFLCIPYACVFTYFAITYLIKKNPINNIQHIISAVLVIILLAVALFNLTLLYTSITFILTAALLSFCLYKKINLAYIYLTYIIITPFFFLSNGLLTGSFLEKPIVWYNDHYNLGIRIFTIPIEDLVYGFLLIGLNILLYEQIKKISSIKNIKIVNKK